MSRHALLAELQAAVNERDLAQARELYEQLQHQHPLTAAEILIRLRLSDEDAAAIGAA